MTPHFSKEELTCKCGCGMLPDPIFMNKVELLRVTVGFPFPVNSAARCAKHNKAVSGTGEDGPHTTGHAIDLGLSGAKALTVLNTALRMGVFTGIGINQKGNYPGRFVHLDDLPNAPGQPRPHIWSY